MDPEKWLSRRYYGGDLPELAERALHAAALEWQDEAASEAHIHEALALARGHLAAHIGAYKFYFYRHRLAEALPHAKACLAEAARRLNVAADWRLVSPSDANFTEIEPGPRLFLFSLLAYGYVLTRLDRVAEGRPILEKVSELDPADRMGARAILALLDRRGVEDDD